MTDIINDRLYKPKGEMKAVKAYLPPDKVEEVLSDPELGVKIK